MKKKQIKCEACEGLSPILTDEVEEKLKELDNWTLSSDGKEIYKIFKFHDFSETKFHVDLVAALAEKHGHHPDIRMGYGNLEVRWTTHAVKALSINDFIMAHAVDEAFKAGKELYRLVGPVS